MSKRLMPHGAKKEIWIDILNLLLAILLLVVGIKSQCRISPGYVLQSNSINSGDFWDKLTQNKYSIKTVGVYYANKWLEGVVAFTNLIHTLLPPLFGLHWR